MGQTVEEIAQEHWGWQSHFGPDDGPAMGMSQLQCGFVWGPRGHEKIVVCDVEGLQDWQGQIGSDAQTLELQLRAVQGVCPECGEGFRIDPSRTPCSIETRPVPIEHKGKLMKFLPLTVYVPIVCGGKAAVVNDMGEITATGICPWQAVVRYGRAYDMPTTMQKLADALAAAKSNWQDAMRAVNLRATKGVDMRQWEQALYVLWQQAVPSLQRIQAGQYERSGPCSLVGAWDVVDHVVTSCRNIRQQLGA